MLQSFRNVVANDPGVRIEGIVTAQVRLPTRRYPTASEKLPYWDRLLERTRALPGVRAGAAVNNAPLSTAGTSFLDIEGRTEENRGAGYRLVTDDYFATVGVKLLEGREFTRADDASRGDVTIINQALAERHWPGESPIGRRIKTRGNDSRPDDWLTIIGVVSNIRYYSWESETPDELFVYFRQRPDRLDGMTLMVHAAGDAEALVPVLRGLLREADPEVPGDFSSLAERRGETLRDRRFIMTLLTGFAVFGLLLAALGVYGVLAYTTALRTREFGIRRALGARSEEVVGMVLRRATTPVLAGMLGGLAGAYALAGLLRSLVYGLDPRDVGIFLGVVPVLVIAAALACVVPARRAVRVDPIIALRNE